MVDIVAGVTEILADILDVDSGAISENTFIIRDLDAESIDLMEIAVALNTRFSVRVVDSVIFLRKIRTYIQEANDRQLEPDLYLHQQYPFLDKVRIREILDDLDNGPVLKVSDLVTYVKGVLHE